MSLCKTTLLQSPDRTSHPDSPAAGQQHGWNAAGSMARTSKPKQGQQALAGGSKALVGGLRAAHERLQAHVKVHRARVPELAAAAPVLRRKSLSISTSGAQTGFTPCVILELELSEMHLQVGLAQVAQ